MVPARMCLETRQPATPQWAIDFSTAAECRHYRLSVLQQTGYNCFDMHSRTYATHPADAFKFSMHGSTEKVLHGTGPQVFQTVTFLFCRSR